MAEEKKKNLIEEFVEFVSRGNVIDLAVGVIIGGAFTSVVNSLVGDLIQPLIAAIGGNPEVKGMAFVVNGQTMDFGAFISAIISFLITAAAVFAIVKAVNQAARLKDLAAEKAGLMKDDVIVALNGEPMRTMQDVVAGIRGKAGVPVEITYERGGVRSSVTATPGSKVDEKGQTVGLLGVMFTAEPDLVYTREGPIGAVAKGFSDTWRITMLTVQGIAGMFTGAVSTDSLGGPVLIGEMAGQAMSFGFISYLLFLALISVNLGILNLLPIPILDGGHLLFHCYEIVTGRRPGEAMQKYGLYVGMAFIGLLTFFALGNDITRLLQ